MYKKTDGVSPPRSPVPAVLRGLFPVLSPARSLSPARLILRAVPAAHILLCEKPQLYAMPELSLTTAYAVPIF